MRQGYRFSANKDRASQQDRIRKIRMADNRRWLQPILDALRVEHPEWVEANGDCPTCESYESRLAELLGLSSPKNDRPVAY